MVRTWAVTNPDSGDARNATVLAISSGRPVRPTIVRSLIFRTRAWKSSSLRPALAISVTIQPGATALTVIPRRPSSIAKRRVRISTSALVAALNVVAGGAGRGIAVWETGVG